MPHSFKRKRLLAVTAVALGLFSTFVALGVVALSLFAAVRSQATTAQTHREDQLQNDDVKVWSTTILPHQPLSMHRHDHPRVIVALTDGTIDIVGSDGTHDVHVWKQGHAYWLPAVPPGAMHSDVNTGNDPIQVMVVELEKEH